MKYLCKSNYIVSIIIIFFKVNSFCNSFTLSDTSGGNQFDQYPKLISVSKQIIEDCRQDIEGSLSFPVVPYAAHEIYLDNQLILQFGDPNFRQSNIVTGAPDLPCKQIISGNELKWIVTSYAPTFTKKITWPKISKDKLNNQFYSVYQYIGGIIGLLIIAIFSFFIMYRKEKTEFIISVFGACLLISVYFFGCIASIFKIDISMLNIHKISDISLGFGSTFLFTAFYLEKQIGKKLITFQYVFQILGSLISLVAKNGDQVQFGTSFQFIPGCLILLNIAFVNVRELQRNANLEFIFKALSSVIFTYFTIYEMLFFSGITDGPSFLPLGMLCSFLILLLSINQRINNTYADLAFLKSNLENEVLIKTIDLEHKSNQLISEANQKYELSKQFAEVAKRTAHDIRSPLTTINYVAKKIHQTNPEDGQSLMLMSKKLIDIANDLLNYNNTESINKNQTIVSEFFTGNLANNLFNDQVGFRSYKNEINESRNLKAIPNLPEFQSDELFQILTEIVEMKRIEHAHSDLRISVYNDLEKPGRVQFDRSQLMRIISNVINNANEAIITRPGMISISMANHFIDGADYIAIEIRDNGPGFPSEVIQRLGQAGNTSGKENGHGIGLSSAYQTMQTWGGQLSVANIKPTGAKVSLIFNLVN